jgi:diguanylate cyclase (GGDEF)-like protein
MITEYVVPSSNGSEALIDAAFTDHLTNIGNRRFFESRLNDRLEDPPHPASETRILLLDLDRFKSVNDSLGHAVGDTLLCLVAQRVLSVLGEDDCFARLGGDEFGIILHSGANPEKFAKHLIDLVHRTYLIDGYPVNVGVSIGMATAPQDARDRTSLMRCADLALYDAKAKGRNRFVSFRPEMATRARAKRDLEIALRKAVALRQMVLQYRPQLDAQTNSLMGFEAVLQWQHPTRGLLDPAEFLPLAEEIGLVESIGEWAVKAVCREIASWPEKVSCSLRVSALLFESERFYEAAESALKAFAVSENQLELEVTETLLLRDAPKVLAMLQRLRSIGVRVAVDSFGTGMASLCQIVNFPLDKIKIARSLVEEQNTGPKERAIVRAIAALGVTLGISTVVEGVSTSEHLGRIQQDGCSAVQGYLTGSAVPSHQLRAMIDEHLQSTTPVERGA